MTTKSSETALREAATDFADAFDAAVADGYDVANWPANSAQMRALAISEVDSKKAYTTFDNSKKGVPVSKIEADQKAAAKIAKE